MVNPVTLEVVRNALVAHADEMAAALCRTAYNMMIFEVKDYCVGLVDPDGGIIAQNTGGLPIFLADLGVAIEGAIEIYGRDGFAEGDVIISNDPDRCGQHLNNVVVFTPFIHEGEVVAFPAVRAHWVDVGGSSRGFGSISAREIFEEGLQICAIKAYDAGRPNEEVLRLIRDNIRFPDSSFGDLRGQIAACRLGERRLEELFGRFDKETIGECIRRVWEHDDILARRAVAEIPDGVYTAESYLDNDYVDIDRPVPIKVRVEVAGERMVVDLSEVSEEVKGPINSGVSGGVAAARVAFKCVTAPHAPVTEGAFGPLEVVLPPGTFLSARRPAPLGGWSLALPTVIDTILKALAPALPDRITAGHKGDMGGYAFYGQDRERKRPFICMNIFGGGWGAKPDGDGQSGVVSVCQGNVHNAPVEMQEAYYPVMIERHSLREGSGGAGEHRGGLGVELVVRSDQDVYVNTQFQRTKLPPWGLLGGRDGLPNAAWVEGEDGRRRSAAHLNSHPVHPGERVWITTGGGGGFGDPLRRPPERVARDVREGYVSIEQARDDYAVAIDPETLAFDAAATEALRRARTTAREAAPTNDV